jgi:crotonobetainyl-CoA:carnitine CoA-transferase CaiB-like acyl-CoA transferase
MKSSMSAVVSDQAAEDIGGPGAALSGVRVLELSASSAAVAGRALADLGAEVIKIEPLGGEPARVRPPSLVTRCGTTCSVFWLAFNINKKSVTLDLTAEAGREVLERLAETADIVLCDWERIASPHEADRLRERCSARNPALVWGEIWPYGRGEHETSPATDLTIQAQGGHLYLNGEIDRAPVRIGSPVATLQGGAEAASAALMAYYHAFRTGVGQRVDVSLQECVVWTLLNTTMTWQCMGIDEVRGGSVKKERGNDFFTRLVWQCLDGFITFGPVGGGGGAARETSFNQLVEWMREEDKFDEVLLSHDWNGDKRFSIPQKDYDAVTKVIGDFIATKTVHELVERGMKRGILLAPIYSISQLLECEQLAARDFYREVTDDARGLTARYPGPFARLSETPIRDFSAAPAAGRDTEEILEAIGLDEDVVAQLRAAEVI